MAWNIEWSEEKAISVKQSGQVTLDEIREMNDKLVAELDAASPPVFIIWDVGELTIHPSKLKDILDVANPILRHSNLTAVIFIGLNNAIIKFLTTVISTIGKLRFHVARDTDDAQAILTKLKASYSMA